MRKSWPAPGYGNGREEDRGAGARVLLGACSLLRFCLLQSHWLAAACKVPLDIRRHAFLDPRTMVDLYDWRVIPQFPLFRRGFGLDETDRRLVWYKMASALGDG